ncbi:bone morphogenetic protein 2-like [Arapaima gigas]
MLATCFVLALLAHADSARPQLGAADETELVPDGDWDGVRTEALKMLLDVFGFEDPPHARRLYKQPPQYMLDLYNTVAGADGITKNPDLLQGNTVRSLFDRLHSKEIQYSFNLSNVAKNEKVLTAELHLFKLRPQVSFPLNRHHLCQVSVHQLLDNRITNTSQSKRLLSSRLLPIHSTGWEIFPITHAVTSCMADNDKNLGLLVTVRSLSGSQMDSKVVRFASGQNHHQSKQPMLVLFTDDGRQAASLFHALKAHSAHPGPAAPVPSRVERSLDVEYEDDAKMPCQRYPLYVDFEEIGWSSWIVAPPGYNAYYCKGTCPFPLGKSLWPTNHATVQSIIHTLKLMPGVASPCCVPNKLYSINLLYFDENENVVLKQYNDMVAGSCGCQ